MSQQFIHKICGIAASHHCTFCFVEIRHIFKVGDEAEEVLKRLVSSLAPNSYKRIMLDDDEQLVKSSLIVTGTLANVRLVNSSPYPLLPVIFGSIIT